MTEKRIKTVIQMAVIAAITLVVILAVTMIVQFAVKANLASRERLLKNELEKLTQQAQSIDDEIAYRKTQEYIEKYAREQLGLVKDGETKYVSK